MLDINDFLAERGGDVEAIKDSQKRRGAPVEAVDDVIASFRDWMSDNHNATTLLKEKINKVQVDLKANKKNKGSPEDFQKLLTQKQELEKEQKEAAEQARAKLPVYLRKLKAIGNYVHPSVPVSNDEANNALIRSWSPEGVTPSKKDCLSHHEVLTRLDGYDPVRGTKIVGHRGYFLTGNGVWLNQALIMYGLDFLASKGYTAVQTPYFMLREAMAKTAQLEQFDEELYKVTERENDPVSDKYLIATSEQPISAMHEGEWLHKKDLPLKYAGYSTNFRKEAGSHGKDAWGIFRVHQFEKIEQFRFCAPDESWKHFDEMIATSEEFYQSLGLPYRVVAIVSGALNNAAAKKFDLEAWFPFQGEYKELVSCSNCTDYQTRELEVRYGQKEGGKPTATGEDGQQQKTNRKEYVHALNSTLCATERALCCIMENYQTENGLKVPEVLRKWIPGQPDILKYKKELPKDSTSLKAKGKVDGAKGPKLPKEGDMVERPKHPKGVLGNASWA
ncbi:serine-tRNA ligase [Piedraia hortae CBS 480.64]|uniref:serine--tRNA ligase n=1 Tax=Piedraia hortae CBS 480.64 TaxID=1314780 RepID=A0A6A7C413_9PEZI|nr:serine-tRNA ligase [Piedraia hortae CBS 480.64]